MQFYDIGNRRGGGGYKRKRLSSKREELNTEIPCSPLNLNRSNREINMKVKPPTNIILNMLSQFRQLSRDYDTFYHIS